MPGRQQNFAIRGDQYEKAFDAIASGFLSIVRTPRQEDYGIDAFCHVRTPLNASSSTVGGTFGVQVRGPGVDLQFGGIEKGTWKNYEIEWLRSLAVPLYLARVSSDCSRIDLYSLWPIWLVLGQTREPFKIICRCDEPAEDPQAVGARSAETVNGSPGGDGKVWHVPIGPPFLSFTQTDMNDPVFVANAACSMANWLSVDRRNIIRALQGVAYVEGIKEWATNDFTTTVVPLKQFMAWTRSRQSVIELVKVLEPIVVNLGVHLQSQDDPAVFSMIPILEWFHSLNLLSGMGKGLLDNIERTQAARKLPNQQPSG
jgi:hypothetical protein